MSVLRLSEDQLAAHQARLDGLLHPLRTAHMERKHVQAIGRDEREVTHSALAAGYAPMVGLCRAAGLAEPVPEWMFAKGIGRRWRFDYAFPLQMVALEIEGGLWVNGRHSRGSGQIADLEKYSEAAIMGWRVLYATPDEVRSGVALDRVRRALGAERYAA